MAVCRWSSITLHQLQVLAAIGRERSFARAAEALCLSQPAVSHQIKVLEELLEVRLIDRAPGRRRVALTEAGRMLLSTAEGVTQMLESADQALDEVRQLDRGSVAFGAALCFGSYIFPGLYDSFRRLYPGITVQAEVEQVHSLIEGLRQRRFDLIVVEGPVEGSGFESESLGGCDMVLIGRPGHRLAHGGPAPFRELASEQLILSKPSFILRSIVNRMAAEAGITLRVAMEVNHIEAKARAVIDGLGIATIGAYGAAAGLATGQLALLQVDGFPIRLRWSVLNRKGELPPAARAFKAHLLKHRSALSGAPLPAGDL